MRNPKRSLAVAAFLAAGALFWTESSAQAQGLGITIGRGGVTIGQPGYYYGTPGYGVPAYGAYPGYYGNAPGTVVYGRGYNSYVAPGYVRTREYITTPGYAPAPVYTYPPNTYRVVPRYRLRRW